MPMQSILRMPLSAGPMNLVWGLMRLMTRQWSAASASREKYSGTSPSTVPIRSTSMEETTGAPQLSAVTPSRCSTAAWPSAVAPPWLPMAGTISGCAPSALIRLQTARTMTPSWSIPRLPTPTATRSPARMPLAGKTESISRFTAAGRSLICSARKRIRTRQNSGNSKSVSMNAG